MMVNPPSAGQDFCVPSLTVADSHGAGLAQGLGWDRAFRGGRRRLKAWLILDDDRRSTV
jgi:hypothetical protein